MADGGSSVTREESGNDLLYPRVRWRGGSQVHHDGMGMARGTAASGLAGRPCSARLANGKWRPAQGCCAQPVGVWRVATVHWRTDVSARAGGTDDRKSASTCWPSRTARRRATSGRALECQEPKQFELARFDPVFLQKTELCSGQTLEYQSCRSLDPLQLLQRAYGLFLNQLCTNCKQSLLFSGRLRIVTLGVDLSFSPI
jgi:hypothetical protein